MGAPREAHTTQYRPPGDLTDSSCVLCVSAVNPYSSGAGA
jgi:hypothetical protein